MRIIYVVVEDGLVTEAYTNIPHVEFNVIDLDMQEEIEEEKRVQARYAEMKKKVENSMWTQLF